MSLIDRFRRSTPAVDPMGGAELVADGSLLLDVRERHEFDAGHAPNARLVPLGSLPAHLDDLPQDRTIVVMCRSGNRSAQATSLLRREGFDAVNLRGGFTAWLAADLPVRRGGRRTGGTGRGTGHRGRVTPKAR
jgi:rhodanese-related sulfurtransferase